MVSRMNKLSEEKLSDQILNDYKTSDRGNWVQQSVDDRAFVNGVQWADDIAKALEANDLPVLSINEVKPARDQVVAQLTENPPRFHATARENSDLNVAMDVADLFSYIWYISKGNKKVKKSIQDYEDIGMSAMMVYVDPYADNGRGEILVKDLDPLDVYIDPNAKDSDSTDAAHIMLAPIVTEEYIEVNYPDFNFEGAMPMDDDRPSHTRHAQEDQVLNVTMTTQTKYRIIDRYTKVKEHRYHIFDTTTGYEKEFTKEEYLEYAAKPAVVVTKLGQPDRYITKDNEVAELMQVYEQTGGIYHYAIDPATREAVMMPGVEQEGGTVLKGTTTKLSITNLGKLMNEGIIEVNFPKIDRIKRVLTIGGKLYHKSVMPIKDYPIVTWMLHHNRNPFPQGDIRLVRPLQEQLNKIDSLIIAYNTNITNVKVFVPEGSDTKDLSERWGKAGAQFFTFDATEGTPYVVQLTQMSNSLYVQRQNLIAQIQRVIGAYSFQDGNVEQAPRTKGGTLLLDEMGLRRSNAKRMDIEEGINQLAKVMLQMIPHVYTDRKVIRVIKPNHGEKVTVFNEKKVNENGIEQVMNDLSQGQMDVVVVSGSMLPSNRWAKFEALKDLYIQGILKDPTPILQHADIPNLDEVLEREDLIKQAQGMLAQYEQEIKELRGDLQTADRESIQSRKKVEVEKFKTKLSKGANKVQSEVEIATKRLNDKVREAKSQKNK